MMLREAQVLEIGLLTLLCACFLSICVANDEQQHRTCKPSSCGGIRNITYPFRLQGDKSGCGDPKYELICENNLTVFKQGGKKYFVAEINYHNYTIRVMDPDQKKGDCFSTPLYSSFSMPSCWSFSNMLHNSDPYPDYKDPYYCPDEWERNTIVLLSCERPISDQNYIPTILCNRSEDNISSSSQTYAYVLAGESVQAGLIRDSCTIALTFVAQSELSSYSISDLQEKLLTGIDLSFLHRLCITECSVKGLACDVDFNNNTIRCYRSRKCLYPGTWCWDTNWFRKYLYPFFGFLLDPTTLPFKVVFMSLTAVHIFDPIYIPSLLGAWILRIIGQGGFGSVYKGELRSGQIVAVKVLVMHKANGQDFINEVATIGRIHHVNVVRLVGFCAEGLKWALIYEYMPNGSLDKFLFSKLENNILLSWERLYKIALGVGRGIEYLHQGCDMQILHFDIKPHNILLDANFIPKVSDFGLAKLHSIEESIVSLTAARGTLGYIAPELFYKNIGGVSYKADVYSFGMLLMEMVGKRKHANTCLEQSQTYFPSWIYDRIDQGEDMEIGDATEDEHKYIRKIVIVALWCVQMNPTDRPSMSKALEMLEGEVELLQMPPRPTLYSREMSVEDHMNNPVGGTNFFTKCDNDDQLGGKVVPRNSYSHSLSCNTLWLIGLDARVMLL
ncbi:Rust resistance kinase Lr10 [Vitis vinifera]|uniref:Rust resistance kinase Lr10 n=1 Tax=Vitis vinifera TaxID=29760 RepID=A0A438HSX7_VITVI|nr:Rust resistance kinase Lr10 [Vitis vinifera]